MLSFFYRLAITPFGSKVAGWLFSYTLPILPLKRVEETGRLLAFHHPRPSYPFHVLIVPKKRLSRLEELSPSDVAVFQDLLMIVKKLVNRYNLAASGYRLILNGGRYQDFPYLHFHLVSDLEETNHA
jgi:histidine triad (HIT) family protein